MDKLIQYREELEKAKDALGVIAGNIQSYAKEMIDAQCDYDQLKNSLLITLYDEEANAKFKRTEAHRTALYRTAFSKQRQSWLFAKANLESERDVYKGLQVKITALQTLISLEKAKMQIV